MTENWTKINIAWLAGLLEGEGCFCKHSQAKSYNIKLVMTDEDVVRKAYLIAGYGTVRGPIFRNNSIKPCWEWVVSKAKYTLAIAYAIYPFMGERRSKKIIELINSINSMKASINGRRCGTTGKYRQGCRCYKCLEAHRTYHREYYRKKVAAK